MPYLSAHGSKPSRSTLAQHKVEQKDRFTTVTMGLVAVYAVAWG